MRKISSALMLCAAALVAAGAGAADSRRPIEAIVNGTAHDALFAIAFDSQAGSAVGAAGAILNTLDGGKSWKAVTPAPTQLSLLGVDLKGQRRIAVGQMGLVLVQEAAGEWQKIDSGTTERLFSVSLNAKGDAVTVGSFGTVLRSADGGHSWQVIAPDWTPYAEDGAQPHIYDVRVDEAGVATIAGEFGLILRNAPGSTEWQLLHKGDASLFALEFESGGVGYAAGQSGTILRTQDDGRSWTALATGSTAILLGVHAAAGGRIVATGMRDMVISGDGGATWKQVKDPEVSSAWYAGVGQASAGSPVMAVGHGGQIIRIGD